MRRCAFVGMVCTVAVAGILVAASAHAEEKAGQVEIGAIAPDFALPELLGSNMIRLADYRGKVIYLDFWSSWCLPCRISLPLLSGLRDEFPRTDFEVVAIDVDRIPQEGRDFLKRFPVTYPVASDSTGETAESYHLAGMPTSFIIDREGVVRHVKRGFKEQDIEELRDVLSTLIERP